MDKKMKKGVLFSLLGGLVFLLAGCENDGLLGGSGEKVTVNFSLGDIDYKGDETITRGYAERTEIVKVPLGDDVFMFASLEADLEAPTRAVALEDGVKVRVIAYNETASTETSMEYTVVNGALTTSTAMTIETGNNYIFVAYSYNSTDSPTYPATTITMAPTEDLLWGTASKFITLSDNSVHITMSHIFAQIKVKATTTTVVHQPVIKSLTGVTVTPGNQVTLTVKTGAIAKGVVAAQTVSAWNNMNTTTVTSDPILVYTGTSNPIYVNINSVTIDGYLAFTGIPPVAFKSALTGGTSYTLVVNFQKTRFAKSNIYWKWNDPEDESQGGYMTFDTTENGHQGYQGLVFKWGSLVGVTMNGSHFEGNIPIFVPIVKTPLSTSTWKATIGKAMKNDTDFPTVTENWDWLDNTDHVKEVPYMDERYVATTGGSGTYMIEEAVNRDTTYQGFRGDICQYLGKTQPALAGYRMPLKSEFEGDYALGLPGPWTTSVDPNHFPYGYTDGTADFLDGSKNGAGREGGWIILPSRGNVILPASGFRHRHYGSPFSEGYWGAFGTIGYYWCGGAIQHLLFSHIEFSFYNAPAIASAYDHRGSGMSVRCVQK
jgi:hypothetical protein